MRHSSQRSAGQSLSASKADSHTASQAKDVWSPGASKRSPSLFFSSDISMHQLHQLGHIAEEDESPSSSAAALDITQARLKEWMSKSAQKTSSATEFHDRIRDSTKVEYTDALPLEHTPPPPGFGGQIKPSPHKEQPSRNWADYSMESNFTPTPTSSLQFNWEILPDAPNKATSSPGKPLLRSPPKPQPPPAKSPECAVLEEKKEFHLKAPPKKQKRADRCKFDTEKLVAERVTGRLKFYHLKKRFGFLTLDTDNSDVFLCEDDLVLSGVNHKQFKDDVSAGLKPRFELSVKAYQEKDKEKKKAVDLVCLAHD